MVSINLLGVFNTRTMYKINIIIVMIYFKKKAGLLLRYSVRLHGPKDYCTKK